MRVGKLVPQLLEPDRRLAVPLRPEERHHLAERIDLRRPLARLCDERPDRIVEARRVRPPVDHERVERVAGVQRHVAALCSGADDVEPPGGQALRHAVAVRRGRDQDAGVRHGQRRAEVVGHAVEQVRLVVVELDGVAARGESRSGGSPSSRRRRCKLRACCGVTKLRRQSRRSFAAHGPERSEGQVCRHRRDGKWAPVPCARPSEARAGAQTPTA